MPTYDYACPCGHEHEVVLSIRSSPRKRRCPSCRRRRAVRQMSGGANTTSADVAKARLFAKYPVLSNRLPFNLEVPGVDVKHAGPLGRAVIESRAHERKLYDRMGAKRGD